MSESNQYRIYKISIHVFFFSYVANSKIYTIQPNGNKIIPGLKYSLITFLLGWWNFSLSSMYKTIRSSMEALHTNFDGGQDYTKQVTEGSHDLKTVWIYNNLKREVAFKINIEIFSIIMELLEELDNKSVSENIISLHHNLKQIGITNLFNDDLEHIVNTYNKFETRLL